MTDHNGFGKAPPISPGARGAVGRRLEVKVVLLDDKVNGFQVVYRAPAQELFNAVVNKLKLLEMDYFDLEYFDKDGQQAWLDHEKSIPKQVGITSDLVFYFSVKFYTPDPNLLEDEYTRYLFALQVKRDILAGLLPCHENTLCLLSAYMVQAEIGDFLEDEYLDHLYLTQLRILPQGNDDLLPKVMEYHRSLFGMSPAEAEFHLLDTSRKVELYGVRMHPAEDHEGLPLNLAVSHAGVVVFQGTTKINTFSWAKVRKLSFKRKKFLIKLHPEGFGYYKDTVEFYFHTRDSCKNFWKKCIEHHTFFRCHAVKRVPRNKTRVVSKGSSFRYCGRTQKQLVEFVRENYVKRPHFERYGSHIGTSLSNSGKAAAGNGGSGGSSGGGLSLGRSPGNMTGLRRTQVSSHGGGYSLPGHNSSTMNSSSARSHASTSSGSHTLLCGELSGEEAGNGSACGTRHKRQQRGNGYNNSRYKNSGSHAPMLGSQGNSRSLSVSPPQSRAGIASAAASLVHRARSLPDDEPDDEVIEMEVEVEDIRRRSHLPGPTIPEDRSFQPYHELDNELPRIPPPALDSTNFNNSNRMLPFQVHQAQPSQFIPHPHGHPSSTTTNMITSEISRTSNIGQRGSTLLSNREETTIIQEDSSLPSHTPSTPPPPPPPPPQASSFFSDEMLPSLLRSSGMSERSAATHLTLSSSMSGASSNRSSDGEDAMSLGGRSERSVGGTRRRVRCTRLPTDRAYFLAKELLLTERTYKKDLEVVCVHLRSALEEAEMPEPQLAGGVAALEPLYEQHAIFLADLEQRLGLWESSAAPPTSSTTASSSAAGLIAATTSASGSDSAPENNDYQRIGDVMIAHLRMLPLYRRYLAGVESLLSSVHAALRADPELESAVRQFEAQKICYLPLLTFFLKPAHRLLHYRTILERLMRHYSDDAVDFRDCRLVHAQLLDVVNGYREVWRRAENRHKLVELQRDLAGFDQAFTPRQAREFVREGWLQKLSKKGYQQRFFVLLSDSLLYASKRQTPFLQFKVHERFDLANVVVEEADSKLDVANSFAVYTGANRSGCFVVAASSPSQRDRWLEDINRAVQSAKRAANNSILNGDSAGGLDLHLHNVASTTDNGVSRNVGGGADRHQIQQRANTTTHVCWHRNATVSFNDILRASELHISGYLLRKFKNSNGWQRLWVVFTHFCMFFYKNFQDDAPLASLPLLGYAVGAPTPEEDIGKDNVFRLRFKTHVYYFRAESRHTYERWVEVLNQATSCVSLQQQHQALAPNFG